MSEEAARAYQVWKDAQADVVRASARRYENLSKAELKEALDNYENAVEYMLMAKNHYDIVRSEQSEEEVRSLPRVG